VKRTDIAVYHPDVDVYEVRKVDQGGVDQLVAIFLHDNFARQHKHSGAWMSEYRSQTKNRGAFVFEKDPSDESELLPENSVPIIVNNNNFAKGSDFEPTLLSFDDARTLFHEFGHGLHGMLSDVTFNRLAGTSVLRDFVELPSQLYEHWLSQPEVLKKHARHYKTNEPIPDELLQKLMSARSFNQGFDTVEYTACALIDQTLHQVPLESLTDFDMKAFETSELRRLGMPEGIVLRHRPPHFQHLFSGSSYAAAYYVYLWAEVLDADGFDAFLEAGDPFHAETAAKVKRFIYSSGNSIDPREAFRLFRGRDPKVEPMLRKKGLLAPSRI
jgi:peptidyl-dipeptidase Dcp